MEEEKSVTLSCELSKPGLAVEWRRGQEPLQSNYKYHVGARSGVLELTIKNAQLADSGLYSCSCGDVKTAADVTVTRESRTGPPAVSPERIRRPSRFVFVFPSDPPLLQSGSEEPGGSGGRQRVPALRAVQDGRPRAVVQVRERALPRRALSDDAEGERSRDAHQEHPAGRRRGVQLRLRGAEDDSRSQRQRCRTAPFRRSFVRPAPLSLTHATPSVLLQPAAASVYFEKELESQAVMEGKPVLLSCEVSSANVPVTWKKDNVALEGGGRYVVKKDGSRHSLEIRNLQQEDAGEFCCITRGKKTTAKLVVRGRSTFPLIYIIRFLKKSIPPNTA